MNINWERVLPKKNRWIIILLIGILLVVIAIPTNQTSKEEKDTTYEPMYENSTDIEKRLIHLLENMEQVGKVDVMITYEDHDTVEGVVVLAEGAGNAVVVRKITEVVQALFDVDSHKIKVIERTIKTNQGEEN